MSKTDTSLGPLVGILRFNLPAKSTRTLNATQAYDTSPSQVVLGSFTGKLTDKTSTEKADTYELCSGTFTSTLFGDGIDVAADLKRQLSFIEPGTLSLSATSVSPIVLSSSSASTNPTSSGIPSGVTFTGVAGFDDPFDDPLAGFDPSASSNSKATNSNTTYYGAITVGLGKYKKWQGNYAVLKINTVTEKAILRIYAN